MTKKITYCLIIFSLVSCNFSNKKVETKLPTKNKNSDIFYTEKSGLDYVRFPLIKPFDITSIDIGESWLLGIGHDTYVYSDKISELTIFKEYIFVHSIGETIIDGKTVQESWYVYNTIEKEFLKKYTTDKDFLKNYGIEKYFLKEFTTKKEFLEHLKSKNIDSTKLNWQKPEDLYKQFKETGCLPWIPNCK